MKRNENEEGDLFPSEDIEYGNLEKRFWREDWNTSDGSDDLCSNDSKRRKEKEDIKRKEKQDNSFLNTILSQYNSDNTNNSFC